MPHRCAARVVLRTEGDTEEAGEGRLSARATSRPMTAGEMNMRARLVGYPGGSDGNRAKAGRVQFCFGRRGDH